MESLRKITTRTVGMQKGVKGIGESFVAFGRCIRAIPDQTEHGEYLKLKGSFRGVNEQTGEEFRAPVLICPGNLLEDEIATALNAAQEAGAGAAVDFAARFKLVEADNPMGCEWRAEMLTDPTEDDPVERLGKQIREKIALPAPADDGQEPQEPQAASKKKAAAKR